jgi:flagellar hook-basal body complex protein FliE
MPATAPGGTRAPEAQRGGRSFSDSMAQAIGETDQLLVDADRAAVGVADGTTDTVEALIALSKAELALRHVVSMTTRSLEAYREVMRMQL